jgi:hypothetical protein
MSRTVVLSVGDTHHLRVGKDHIVYAGMTSERVYSIVEMKWEFFYRGYAWNLFFPVGQNTIRIDGVNLIVESVTPTEIRLQV